METKKRWWQKRGWVVVVGGIIILLIISVAAGESNNSPSPSVVNASNNQTTTTPQTVAPQSESTTSQEDNSVDILRKTTSGVVRISAINFNNVINMNQQTIIFGGDANAVNDGTGWICIINGEQNFANTVVGDTVTATGGNLAGTHSLINCRIDSIQ